MVVFVKEKEKRKKEIDNECLGVGVCHTLCSLRMIKAEESADSSAKEFLCMRRCRPVENMRKT